MRIEWPIWLAIFPGLTAIQATQQCPGLSGCKTPTRLERIEGNPTDVTRIRSWRKTPCRSRGQLAQGCKLAPAGAAILGAEHCAWLGACVDHALATGALHCTDCYRHYSFLRDALVPMLPRPPRLPAPP